MSRGMDGSVYAYFDDSSTGPDVPPSLLVRPNTSLPIAENQVLPALSPRELALWRWANVDNLDTFLQDVYLYFLDKGFWSIILKRTLNMITVLFVVTFTTYLGSCVDYTKLRGARVLSDVRVAHCLAKTSLLHKLGLWAFGALWLAKVSQYVGDLQRLLELKAFYEHLLSVDENEIQTISWQQIVTRIVDLSTSNMAAAGRASNSGSSRALDAHSIANHIMRKENYLIALYTKNVLDLNITLPFHGDYEFLTKTLEWSISLCVIDFVFNEQGKLRPIFLQESKRQVLAEGLRRRFQFAALMNVVFAPFAVVYMSLYYFFRYFNDYHRDPSSMGSRQYTPLAEWKLREFNELYHLFTRRLGMSTIPAARYISQFPRAKTDITLRFLIFVFSAFAAVLGIISIYDPELLGLEITHDATVLFYIGLLGTAIAVARGMLATEAAIFEPEVAMRQIVEFTHYMPEQWEGKLHTEEVKNELCLLYDLKVKVLLRDLLSIFLNPIILWYNLVPASERIIDFFRDSSVHVDDLGYVTSFAVFNYDKAQRVKARADDLDKYYTTTDGKMLKSYLNFMDVYGPRSARGISRRGSDVDQNRQVGPHVPDVNSRRSSVSSMDSSKPDLTQSVMDQFNRLQHLPAVVEEEESETLAHTNVSAAVSADSPGGELNLLPQDSPEGPVAEDDLGVFGILNRFSRTETRFRH